MGGKPRSSVSILPSGGRATTLAEVLAWPAVKALRDQMEDYLDVDQDHKVIVWEGDLHVAGDLLLDDKKYSDKDAVAETSFFVVRGNLHVDGAIINEVGDYGIGLLVLGDVTAENAIFGGSQGLIDGDIKLAKYGLSFYNHGTVISTGSVTAQTLINHDNEFPGKPGKGVQVLEWGGDGEYSLADHLLPEFVDNDYPAADLLIAAILAGKPLFDEGKPKTKKGEIQRAVAAWKERNEATREFSMRGYAGKQLPAQLTELDCVESLDVSGTKCAYPEALGALTQLRKLVAQGMDMELLSGALSKLPQLRELDICDSYSISSPKVLRALSCLKELQVLRVEEASSELLKLFPNLEVLETKAMDTAQYSPRLRELTLNGAKKIPEEMDRLAESLEVFEFKQDPWEKPDPKTTPVPTFSEFRRLHSVTLYGSYNLKTGMQLRYMQSLFAAPKLRTLHLVGWNCSASDFNGIEELQSLRVLAIADAELRGTPVGLEKLTGLRTLDLQGNLLRSAAKRALEGALPNTAIVFEKGQAPTKNTAQSLSSGVLLKGKKLESFLDKIGRGPNSYLGEHDLEDAKAVLCFDGALHVDGVLDLSTIDGGGNIAIAGNLSVSGDIIAGKGTLVVSGTTEAKNIITTGGGLFFYGSVDAASVLVLGESASLQAHQPMAADLCLVDVGEEESKLGVSDFACDRLFVLSPDSLDQQGSITEEMIRGAGRILSITRAEFLDASGRLEHSAVVQAVRDGRTLFQDEPKRPPSVPVAATWNSRLFQWELGETSLANRDSGSDSNTTQGSYSQWRLPGGFLALQVNCALEGEKLRRVEETFHPNGELAESTTWLGDHKLQEIYSRTKGEEAGGFCIPYYYNYDEEVRRVTVDYPEDGDKQVHYDYWPA